jgi:hypothetical protein
MIRPLLPMSTRDRSTFAQEDAHRTTEHRVAVIEAHDRKMVYNTGHSSSYFTCLSVQASARPCVQPTGWDKVCTGFDRASSKTMMSPSRTVDTGAQPPAGFTATKPAEKPAPVLLGYLRPGDPFRQNIAIVAGYKNNPRNRRKSK